MTVFRSLDMRGRERDVHVRRLGSGWTMTDLLGRRWPDDLVRTTRDRINAALANSGLPTCPTVMLAGDRWWPGYDLGIYLHLAGYDVADRLVVGEMGLDGEPRPVEVRQALLLGPVDPVLYRMRLPEEDQ